MEFNLIFYLLFLSYIPNITSPLFLPLHSLQTLHFSSYLSVVIGTQCFSRISIPDTVVYGQL
jgi:hypothetical protein